MEQSLRVEVELQKLNDTLGSCKQVADTVGSNGWKNVIEPLIDKSILDIVGGKVNGKWYGGLLDRARKDERREFYIGYKQALIDLHRRIRAYVDNVELYESKKQELIKNKEPKFTRPMIDDTRYGRDFSE